MNTITLKGIIDEDFVNYRVPSMTLMFPTCSFKCGKDLCQNQSLKDEKPITVDINKLCKRYINNPITEAVVCQGLEPLDSFDELKRFVSVLRNQYDCQDPIVIYSGYYPDEIDDKVMILRKFNNIIIKFGRYIPNSEPVYDEILGVELASNNQFTRRYYANAEV